MRRGVAWASLGAGLLLAWSSVAEAQCSKDTDCKGDRVCEGGKCVSPAPASPVTPVAPAAAAAEPVAPQPVAPAADGAAPAPAAEPAPATAPAAVAAPAPAPVVLSQPASSPNELPPPAPAPAKNPRRGALITGIVLTSIAPLAFLGALSAHNSQDECDRELEQRYPNHIVPSWDSESVDRCDEYTTTMWVLGVGGGVLMAVGVPLIIYGTTKPTPSPQARLLPWASPTGGGLKVRLEL